MSTAALQNVWSTIMGFDLTTNNKRWLAEHLWQDATKEAAVEVPSYTIQELQQMAETGRQQIAVGESFTADEVLLMCENEHL